eukprot:SAG22_NODE_20075_length_269_cov_0.576471_1_plen_22_part_10
MHGATHQLADRAPRLVSAIANF